MMRILAVVSLLLAVAWPAGAQTTEAAGQRYLAEIEVHTADEMLSILQRTEDLLQQGAIPLDGDPRVAFVLHGPEVYVLLRQNYFDNKEVVDRAASLSALGVVEIMACETWMGIKGIDPDELQPFVATVPYGPAEERRLVKEENYLRF